MNAPLVSIVSLLYDIKPQYVNECVKSLLNQTYKNIEILFFDDCSPHEKYDYLEKLSPKIKLIKNEKNLGFNRNTQKAFESANGKYIVKIDSDDYIDSTLIEKEVTILENNPNVGAVACELKRFGKSTAYIKRPEVWSLEEALYGDMRGYGYEGGFLFRKDLLKEVAIDPNYRVCTDFDFNLQVLERMEIMSIHEPLYHYRSHNSNIMISARGGERVRIINQILEKHRKLYEQRKRKFDNLDFVYIIKPNDDGNDLKYSLRSISKHYPNNKIWIAGYKPDGIDNVNYLEIEQTGTKWKNSTNNVIQICKCKDISDDFILMNDDFFAINPTKSLEDIIDSNIGLLDRYINKYKNHKGEWEQGFKHINDLLSKLNIKKPYYCYEGHTPLRINKEKFLEVINLPEVQEFMKTPNVLFKRTLYKQYDKPKKSISLPIDIKTTANNDDSKKLLNICGWLSISDGLIDNPKFKDLNQIMEENLSEPCKYEVEDNSKIDVFYVLGTGSKWGNKELMYSLRSLEMFGRNIKNVYVVGNKPTFTNNNVKWIEAYDIGYPSTNHWHKVRKFFNQTNIRRAVYMMDDVFFTKEVDFTNYPYYQRGQLEITKNPNSYHTSLNNTKIELEKMNKPTTNFEVHCPIIYEKDKFLELTDKFDSLRKKYRQFVQVRSIYCNYNNIEGIYTDDVKIYKKDMPNPYEKMNKIDCFSISDDVIRMGIDKILQEKYPNKSKYEK